MKHELGLLIPQFAEKIVAPKMTGVDDFLVLVLIGKQMFVYAIFGFQILLGIPFPLPSLVYRPRSWAEMNYGHETMVVDSEFFFLAAMVSNIPFRPLHTVERSWSSSLCTPVLHTRDPTSTPMRTIGTPKVHKRPIKDGSQISSLPSLG